MQVLTFKEGQGFKVSQEEVEIGIAIQKNKPELKKALDDVLGKMTKEDFNKLMDEAIAKQPLSQK